MKLSIIVCAYNTKKEYLKACLSSITKSTLDKNDYEIVLIDDGSCEDYSQLINIYKPTYIKTDNRGHFASRLYGIMVAKGDYIAFCDSDDTVSFNYHAPMLKKAIDENLDIVLNDWAFHTEKSKAYPRDDITIKEDISLEGDEILRYYANAQGKFHSVFVLWNKIYKRDVLLKAKAEVEKTDAIMERLSYSEDALINFFAHKNASRLANVHTGYYFYRVHGEQSVSLNDDNKVEKRLESQIKLMAKTIRIMKASIGEHRYKEEIEKGICEWGKLMSRVHYTSAKSMELEKLYDLVKTEYQVDSLEISIPKDELGYIANGLLGDNFDIIDTMLYDISKKDGEVSVFYDKKDEYVSSTIDYLNASLGKKIICQGGNIVIPKRKIKLTQRLTHSKLAYSVALRLFKKGSKIRRKLKSRL
ncbi:MAG: glycosyltransferase family 2 protein [Clostridia bacterium]|nr:glycosyltransferase family 2 protein [Clostridia bacterium]